MEPTIGWPVASVWTEKNAEDFVFLVAVNQGPIFESVTNDDDAVYAFKLDGTPLGRFTKHEGDINPIENIGGIVQARNGNVLVASWHNHSVLEFDLETGNYIGVFGDASGEKSPLKWPAGITNGPDGCLYVVSLDGEQILKYDGLTGKYLGAAVSGNLTDDLQDRYDDLAFDEDGNIWVGYNPPRGTPGMGKGEVPRLVFGGD